ncbi:hypothetical protein GGQ97_000862 [Sphingomonas kaistensis]|uniref:Uncharacterized protein n=1 Tax=Sphingomonas kaistensis TaxID=298708 RepID=A0A7X5Y4J9_9SPHN|nr:hypothetical protein [Sphingomonas kaistensis]NJC05069.1 hypothetical protein [Sphingomonas kaistensis]
MGYRQSNFDPLATQTTVHPIARPFDRWQWFGVLAEVVALALLLLFFADRTHILRTGFDSPVFIFPFVFGGSFLLRRDPELAPGTLGERKWQMFMILIGFALLPLAFGE